NDTGDQGETDTVVFGIGIDPAAMLITRSDDDLVINVTDSSRLELDDHFSQRQIERFGFADGSVLSIDDIEQLQVVQQGTNAKETIYGSGRDDVVDGHNGNDSIYGYGGDDTLMGGSEQDTLEGGLG